MKTTAYSTSTNRKNTTSQANEAKPQRDLSSSMKNLNQSGYNKQQITDSSSKPIKLIHPYIERLGNNCALQSQSRPKLSQSANKRRPQSSLTANPKELSNIKAFNQKDFVSSINNDCSLKQSEATASKVKLLEQMIVSIKEQAQSRYEADFNEQLHTKAAIEQSIEEYKRKINQIKSQKKLQTQSDKATLKQIDILKNRCKESSSLGENSPEVLRIDIKECKRQIQQLRDETKQINNAIINEKNYIEDVQELIKKVNKNISDKKKEKINFYPAIQLMGKHIEAIRTKIKTQLRSNNEMTHKMTSLIEKGI